MSSTTMKSFAHSSGKSANGKSGELTGKLLGKMADGLEAIEALACLAAGKANRFYELAMTAVKVQAKKLEAALTKPYANPDMDFNAPVNAEKAALRRAPALGLGGGRSTSKRHREEDK